MYNRLASPHLSPQGSLSNQGPGVVIFFRSVSRFSMLAVALVLRLPTLKSFFQFGLSSVSLAWTSCTVPLRRIGGPPGTAVTFHLMSTIS
jgi:hypothetical protein